jgi:succinate-semialdehyde dehydrogenase
VQTVRNGSVETTQELMKAVDVVVATGGGAMVKSAYSSGRPSLGVGAGNVPVIIDRDADLRDAAEKIVTGAGFDNGIICSHEQFVLTPAEKYDETVRSFQATGKVWYTDDEAQVQKLRDVVFPGGRLNKDVVGRTAREVGAMAGIDVPASARIILLPARGAGTEDVLAKEKLCPVVAIHPYETFEEAVAKARANLLVEGAGHSAALHSNTERHIRSAGVELPVSRLVVNQACALTAGGSLTNGLAPTTTLGCGSWGGNSISENLDYKHLMNVSRIGKVIANKKVPTDEEIFS